MAHMTSLANNSEPRASCGLQTGMASELTSNRVFIGISASLFLTSAAVTIVWCASMSAMQGMSMPGGWTMSMMWMLMPGQTWPVAAAGHVGMWACGL